jgi:hypothetical protein
VWWFGFLTAVRGIVFDMEELMLVNKLVALVLIILGFLVLASSYRYENQLGTIGGLALLLIGIALLVLKVVRRNP